jgi:PKD repeat protein
MAERKGEGTLLWGVLLLIFVAGVAAFALSPPGPPNVPGSNQPPHAVLAPTNWSANLGDTVSFTAENSSDPDGTIKGFAWQFGDGTGDSGAIVTHQYQVTGAFTVRLELTDDRGAKNSTTTHIWVNLRQELLGTASWNKFSPGVPSNVQFPVDPNATKVEVTMQLNTSAIAGAHAVVSLLDPNGAVMATQNVTIAFGGPTTITPMVILADNLTVSGQWVMRVEAQPANPSAQVSATIGYFGVLRVEYKPA